MFEITNFKVFKSILISLSLLFSTPVLAQDCKTVDQFTAEMTTEMHKRGIDNTVTQKLSMPETLVLEQKLEDTHLIQSHTDVDEMTILGSPGHDNIIIIAGNKGCWIGTKVLPMSILEKLMAPNSSENGA